MQRLRIASALALIVFGSLLLASLTMPIYVLRGVGSGYIAFTSYRVELFNESIHVSLLEKVKAFSYPLLIQAIYTVFSGAMLLLNPGRIRREVVYGLALSASVAGYIASAAVAYMGTAVESAVSELPKSFRFVSSAGVIDFGDLIAEKTFVASLLSPLALIALASASTAFTAMTMVHPVSSRERK